MRENFGDMFDDSREFKLLATEKDGCSQSDMRLNRIFVYGNTHALIHSKLVYESVHQDRDSIILLSRDEVMEYLKRDKVMVDMKVLEEYRR